MTTRRRRGVRERRPPLGPPMRGRAIRCERAVLPRKNVAARSPDTLLPFGLIAEACSAEIAGHPDISRPGCIALPRAGGRVRIFLAAISLCGHMDALKDRVAPA